VLVEVLEAVVRLPEQGGQRLEAARGAVLADLEQDALGPVDGDLGVVRFLVADRGDLAGCRDQVAQDRLALDDAPVVLDVHRRRHRVHQRREVGGTAHRLQPVAPGELLPQGHEVDGLALAVKPQHRLIDVRMLLAVEVRRAQELGDLQNRIRVDQDRAEDALLGFDRLRCQLVDAHFAGKVRVWCRARTARIRRRAVHNPARLWTAALLVENRGPARADGLRMDRCSGSVVTASVSRLASPTGGRLATPLGLVPGVALLEDEPTGVEAQDRCADQGRFDLVLGHRCPPFDGSVVAVDDRLADPDARTRLLVEGAGDVVADTIATRVGGAERLRREDDVIVIEGNDRLDIPGLPAALPGIRPASRSLGRGHVSPQAPP
jgi:hypothetical protein